MIMSLKQRKMKFEPRIKLNHDTYIDFYAQIRRNVDKESVNFKRHLFQKYEEINFTSGDVKNDKFNGDPSLFSRHASYSCNGPENMK